MENIPREPGSEEYLNSEKYEIKHWDIGKTESLKDFIARINRIRRENPALQDNRNLWFNATDNEQLICYSKHTEDLSNIIMTVVNLDPHRTQSGWINVPLVAWGLDAEKTCEAQDLLNNNRYTWQGEWNYIELNPDICPAHVFQIVDSNHNLRH
jgi:starch synthase (maltosyl-transferring)